MQSYRVTFTETYRVNQYVKATSEEEASTKATKLQADSPFDPDKMEFIGFELESVQTFTP
jgi:hypothetical protein|tara:strand:- start:447 stop:626 length:180 start_codon:yes stop_codon:yes gene_type:complete